MRLRCSGSATAGRRISRARNFGNEGVVLMQLAERTKDAVMAQTAARQIEAALQTMRAGKHMASAAYFEACLLKAGRIRDALKSSLTE